uniref:Uncharacterized protein n=1 Tax=Melanopsichium pennsylvanicum 4 TaxID=1398559 RepID=A0A077R447_9BASI|nr:uncharacterized protein BN887_06121 [Melanopsichium pennsylvanicum 4]
MVVVVVEEVVRARANTRKLLHPKTPNTRVLPQHLAVSSASKLCKHSKGSEHRSGRRTFIIGVSQALRTHTSVRTFRIIRGYSACPPPCLCVARSS